MARVVPMGRLRGAVLLTALVAALFHGASGLQMYVSSYENTPLTDYSRPGSYLTPLTGGDYSTAVQWPPVMTGTLRTDIVVSAAGNVLTFEVKCKPAKASINVTGNTYTMTPTADADGTDVFTYNVQEQTADGTLLETSQETNQVSVEIFPVNQPPVVTYKELALVITSTLEGTLEPSTGKDTDGHSLVYTIVTAPKTGTLRLTTGDSNTTSTKPGFVFTPDGVSVGSEDITYMVDDCSGNDLIAVEDQTGYNRKNCLNATGTIRITTRTTSGLPNVFGGSISLAEDQAVHRMGVLTREPGSNPLMEPYLRFLMKELPALGSVDFLCRRDVPGAVVVGNTSSSSNATSSSSSPSSSSNWTHMMYNGYCTHAYNDTTTTQTYRYRPNINKNGEDAFAISLRATALYADSAEPDRRTVNVTISPVNDAPEITPNYTVFVGAYTFRANETQWVDPLDPNATLANYSRVVLNVTSIDAEPAMRANITHPGLGRLYTKLAYPGSYPYAEYVQGDLLNMTLLSTTDGANKTTTFGVELYYVAPPGWRGSPLTKLTWTAWDGTLTRSFPAEAVVAVLCPVGYAKRTSTSFSVGSGNETYGECEACVAGTYSPSEDATRCTACPLGYYSETGSGRCTACPVGYFGDAAGSGACTRCPLNLEGDTNSSQTTTGTASTSKSQCVCAAADPKTEAYPFGYYGRAGERCRYCNSDKQWTCTENNLTLPMTRFGYWMDVCQAYPAKARQCSPPQACEGIGKENITNMFETSANVSWSVACAKLPAADTVDGTCQTGYGEAACATCIRPGYYRMERSCHKCPTSDGTMMVILISIAVVVAAPILFKVSEQAKNFPSLNIGLSFSQFLGVFSIHLEYPDVLTRFLSVFSFANLNLELVHPECSIGSWNFSKKWMVMSLSPFIIAGILTLSVLAGLLLHLFNEYPGAWILRANPHFLRIPDGHKRGSVHKLKYLLVKGLPWNSFVKLGRSAIRAQLTFFQVAYMFLSSSAFELFDCTKNDDGNYYLDSEPSVRCGWPHASNENASQEWVDVYQYAIGTIVLYPVGILLLFASLLYSIRYSLDTPAANQVLGFFYGRYEKQWYWYELVQLSKKMILVAILSLMPDGDISMKARKACCSIALVTLVTLCHFYAAPYASSNLDNMMSMALGAEFVLLFSGLIFLTDKMSPTFRLALTIINVVVILGAVVFLIVFVALDIAPDKVKKLRKWWGERHMRKKKMELRKSESLRKKERKARGEEEVADKPLGMYAQVAIFDFIKRAMVSRQAAKFFNPRATDAVAAIRTAWGQKRVRELGLAGELDQPDVTKDDLKRMFERLHKRSEVRETFSITAKPDPVFADFLKDATKSETLEGLAVEDIAENHRTDAFFERLMCDKLPKQTESAAKNSWYVRSVNILFQGRSTWLRKRHATDRLQAMETTGLLTRTKVLDLGHPDSQEEGEGGGGGGGDEDNESQPEPTAAKTFA